MPSQQPLGGGNVFLVPTSLSGLSCLNSESTQCVSVWISPDAELREGPMVNTHLCVPRACPRPQRACMSPDSHYQRSNQITWDAPLLPACLGISGVYSISLYKIWTKSSHYLKLVHLCCNLDVFPSGGVVQTHRPSTWEAGAQGPFAGLHSKCQGRLVSRKKKEETITKKTLPKSPHSPKT